MPIVMKVINIFRNFQRYCFQNNNKHLLSYLPILKVNISCDIKSMLAPIFMPVFPNIVTRYVEQET